MSFWQLVLGKCLSGFVHFGKKYIRKMSNREHALEVLTVNQNECLLVTRRLVVSLQTKKLVH